MTTEKCHLHLSFRCQSRERGAMRSHCCEKHDGMLAEQCQCLMVYSVSTRQRQVTGSAAAPVPEQMNPLGKWQVTLCNLCSRVQARAGIAMDPTPLLSRPVRALLWTPQPLLVQARARPLHHTPPPGPRGLDSLSGTKGACHPGP